MTLDEFEIELDKLVVKAAKDNRIERLYGCISAMEIHIHTTMVRLWQRQEQEAANQPTEPKQ